MGVIRERHRTLEGGGVQVPEARAELSVNPSKSSGAFFTNFSNNNSEMMFQRPVYVPSPADLDQSNLEGSEIVLPASIVTKTAGDNVTMSFQFLVIVHDLNLPDISDVTPEFDAYWGPGIAGWQCTAKALVTRLDTGAATLLVGQGYDDDVAVTSNVSENRLIANLQFFRIDGDNGAGLSPFGLTGQEPYDGYFLPNFTRTYSVQYAIEWDVRYV